MILLIAGSRVLKPKLIKIHEYIKFFKLKPKKIISGGAKGVDTRAELYAHNFEVRFKKYKANWDKYGKAAGHARNEIMAEKATHCLLIWNGTSKGSKNMLTNMRKLKKPVFQVIKKGKHERRVRSSKYN